MGPGAGRDGLLLAECSSIPPFDLRFPPGGWFRNFTSFESRSLWSTLDSCKVSQHFARRYWPRVQLAVDCRRIDSPAGSFCSCNYPVKPSEAADTHVY